MMRKTVSLLICFILLVSVFGGCTKTADTAGQNAAEAVSQAASAAEETQSKTQEAAAASSAEAISESSPEKPAESSLAATAAEKEEITIIYTNDIHSYIYNTVTNKETKETSPGLRPSNVAAMKKDLIREGKNVLLVDAGDEIQGNIYGSLDKGESVIGIMNTAGYDLATPGNHEFGYGIVNFFDRVNQAKYPFISCTFRKADDHTAVLDPWKIFDFNGTKVAFVGVSTAKTPSSVTPSAFQDENRKQIYDFSGRLDPEEFYRDVQAAIDEVKDQADYVIGLGHVGIDAESQQAGVSSRDLIAHTEGFDAFIDGHSHTSMPMEMNRDKSGKEIPLTQTGCYLSAIGVMNIGADGSITTQLITEYPNKDADTAKAEDSYDSMIQTKLSTKLGELENTLYTGDPVTQQRLVRRSETNLGDFIPDAYYWYLNEVVNIPCDVVVNNGGGIRAPIEKGDISYMSIRNVVPFGNTICQIKITGAQLRDVLENGVSLIGEWDPVANTPAEQGPFMHVAGMRFTVDAAVPSSVECEGDVFQRVKGEYRVKDLQIYNRETAQYEDVDLERTYTIGGIDYILRNGGCGLAFLGSNECIHSYIGPEAELVVEYVRAFKKSGEYAVVNSANSPLAAYKNYLLDYENPYGSGRVKMINLKYDK